MMIRQILTWIRDSIDRILSKTQKQFYTPNWRPISDYIVYGTDDWFDYNSTYYAQTTGGAGEWVYCTDWQN